MASSTEYQCDGDLKGGVVVGLSGKKEDVLQTFSRYWRTRGDIIEVVLWVMIVMVLSPALLLYSGYAAWSFVLVIPILLLLSIRIIWQVV